MSGRQGAKSLHPNRSRTELKWPGYFWIVGHQNDRYRVPGRWQFALHSATATILNSLIATVRSSRPGPDIRPALRPGSRPWARFRSRSRREPRSWSFQQANQSLIPAICSLSLAEGPLFLRDANDLWVKFSHTPSVCEPSLAEP
jgi:hypothetical protein